MRSLILLSLAAVVVLSCLSTCLAGDLNVGLEKNSKNAIKKAVLIKAIPKSKITRDVFYSDPKSRVIKGVNAKDLDGSKAVAIITAGGVGSTFVNIRLTSAMGRRLNYRIRIFV